MRAPRLVASILLAGGLTAVASAPAAAADPEPSTRHTATRATAAIHLDGDLSDAAWAEATAMTDFVQREPTEGAPPTHRTEARVLFDDAAIYVGVRAFDSEPDRILAFLTRRDTDSASDWIRVLIDSSHDRRTAYEFI
ncbi:MAG TPA: sugar-binding protein, partial [Vicinamibacterales bacterium]